MSVPVMADHAADIMSQKGLYGWLGQVEAPAWRYKLTAGQTLDFTSLAKDGDQPASNALLPINLGFASDGQHTLKLRLTSSPVQGQLFADLEFQELGSKKTVVWQGQLDVRPSTKSITHGPVLFSYWKFCEGNLTARRPLGNQPAEREATGAFQVNGQTYPALIDGRPASVLRIFIPEHGWWSVENYPAVAVWSQHP